jgi:NADP-dependent 3-hydroxy acid dehydrogenase YdfG
MSRAAEAGQRTVFVTGAAHGIGLETARALVKRGNKVAMADIDGAAAVKMAAELPTARGLSLDVRNVHEWRSALAEAERTLGPLDAVINNAGVMHPGLALDQTDDRIAQMLDVNLAGTIAGCRAAMAVFKPRAKGHIINVCSLAGFVALKGQAVYAATKHAVRAFHTAFAMENAGAGYAFTIVYPGAIDTRLLRGLAADEASALAFASKLIPASRVGAAIAEAITKRPPEVMVYDGSVTALKLGGIFPWVLKRGLSRAERQGAETMKKLKG